MFHLVPIWPYFSPKSGILGINKTFYFLNGKRLKTRDVKFSIQIWSDWPPNRTNMGLFKISFVSFWLGLIASCGKSHVNAVLWLFVGGGVEGGCKGLRATFTPRHLQCIWSQIALSASVNVNVRDQWVEI